MNKKAIARTAITYWSEENECFVSESPLFETIAGVGESEQEARRVFLGQLNDAYETYLEGRILRDRPGRPAKGGVSLDTNVKPETKAGIKALAESLGCSLGEVIDFLYFAYQHNDRRKPAGTVAAERGHHRALERLKATVDSLAARLKRLEAKPTRKRRGWEK